MPGLTHRAAAGMPARFLHSRRNDRLRLGPGAHLFAGIPERHGRLVEAYRLVAALLCPWPDVIHALRLEAAQVPSVAFLARLSGCLPVRTIPSGRSHLFMDRSSHFLARCRSFLSAGGSSGSLTSPERYSPACLIGATGCFMQRWHFLSSPDSVSASGYGPVFSLPTNRCSFRCARSGLASAFFPFAGHLRRRRSCAFRRGSNHPVVHGKLPATRSHH